MTVVFFAKNKIIANTKIQTTAIKLKTAIKYLLDFNKQAFFLNKTFLFCCFLFITTLLYKLNFKNQ